MTTKEQPHTGTRIDITSDVSETRDLYLTVILLLTTFGIAPIVFFASSNYTLWHMVPFMIGIVAAFVLYGKKYHLPAAWFTLLSIQSLPLAWLIYQDANIEAIYYLTLIPIILSGLLLSNRQATVFAVLSVVGLFYAMIHGDQTPTVEVPIIIALVATVNLITRETHGSAFRELTDWALEAQSKSERRSLMYYEQREQLQEALHNLTVANFQLEEMNIKLDEAYHQAEQANAAKSMFLAAMSHELRTPLNSILNFSQFMINGMMGPTTEKQQESLGYIHTSGQHLLSLINDVLDISKIEAGALELFVEDDVDVIEELRTILKTAESLLANKPVEICIEAENDLPLIVGDRQRIFQIVMNLVSNACKFTQQGTIKLKALRKNGSVILAVEDSGPGIAPEEQAAVFETFRQTKRGFSAGGTGLGLPISKRLAEAHGGHLWLESEPGHGATFFVELPVRSQDLLELMHERED